ncbi:MAG TPA: hypothetical protein VFS20_14245 [Longimicrobium sp.]|nr:hypothetical protein [Longimicrobium sp.]
MRSHTPGGFYFAALCAAAFGAVMVAVMLPADESLVVRAPAALLAALSGVAAEALWRARPWAYRATLTLALAYAAVVTLICVAGDGLDGLEAAFWILFFSAWVVLPIVLYVRDRSSTMFGTPRRPRPAPPLPPGVRQQPWW